MAETVSIIIPNWNGKKWLSPCLESLYAQTYQDFVVYVVDNGSEDGSVSYLKESHKDVIIVENQDNLGFATGVNCGINVAQGKYIVALNNDTEVAPDWLQVLVSTMDENPQAGLAASQLMDFQNRDIIDSIGDGLYPFGTSFKIGAGSRYNDAHTKPLSIQSPCAAASIYRKSMLDQIGAFDDDFFAYMEDIDLGLRARLAGYECIFIPGAEVYHIGSASSGGTASAFSIRMTTRNIYAVIFKNVPLLLLPIYLLLTLAAQMAVFFASFLPNRFVWMKENRGAFLSGLGQAFKNIPKNIGKRRSLAKFRREGTLGFINTTYASIVLKRET